MTTIKDYARDLVLETQKRLNEKYTPDVENNVTTVYELTEDEIEELVDEFIELLKNRIVGD